MRTDIAAVAMLLRASVRQSSTRNRMDEADMRGLYPELVQRG